MQFYVVHSQRRKEDRQTRSTAKKLWSTLSTILGTSKPSNIPSAQDFLDFFNKKIEAVRKATGNGPPTTFLPQASSTMNIFQLYNEEDISYRRRR